MIDFHSHALPGIDDGARDERMSLKMLSASFESGVKTVVCTPHCFVTEEDSIERFLSKRAYAFELLKVASNERKIPIPEIVLGAEVHITRNLSKAQGLEKLCLSGTDYILLEMPYEQWKDWMYEEVYEITLRGLKPILAHLDRYSSQEENFENLYSINALVQINANAFIDKSFRRKLLNYFANDAVHVIGSDMHNITSRPPNLAEAYDVIEQKFGPQYSDFLKTNSARILENKDALLPTRLSKLSPLKKLMIGF